jgi:hypothetical protein
VRGDAVKVGPEVWDEARVAKERPVIQAVIDHMIGAWWGRLKFGDPDVAFKLAVWAWYGHVPHGTHPRTGKVRELPKR